MISNFHLYRIGNTKAWFEAVELIIFALSVNVPSDYGLKLSSPDFVIGWISNIIPTLRLCNELSQANFFIFIKLMLLQLLFHYQEGFDEPVKQLIARSIDPCQFHIVSCKI
ncbi:hypothetical protein SLEP1_g50429 [Rubroshorea leprosula]|uniref:Uncharacterized protein n=1 Tax=Rubroshorea leprosula TaxID=152421 RepID=A0AAV5M3D5_9ROSI|nr:hypothetical protein SLEP1_g50429 [Rubroshorea leprosula]